MSPESHYYFFLPHFKTVSFLPHVIIIIIIIASGVTEAVLQFPVVTLRRLDQRQFDNPVNVSNGGNTITFRRPDSEYQVPEGTQSITLLCWASYPVYWALNENQYNARSIWRMRTGTRRTVHDLFDYSRYNYTATLELHGSGGGMGTLSGRYTCQGSRNRSSASSVYLYWDESGKFNPNQFLVLAKETHTIPSGANLILPCYLTKPTAPRPLLYKDSQELRPNSSINFDPKIGFTLTNLPNAKGIYKCVINETEDYVVIIASGGNKTLKSVKFEYNIDKREVSCCSEDHTAGAKSPDMTFYYCETVILCEVFGNHLPPGNGQHLDVVRSTSRPGCSIFKVRFLVSGLIICGGKDFVNSSRHIVFPFTALIDSGLRRQANGGGEPPKPLHPPAWSSWEEIEPEDMLGVLSMERTPDVHGFIPNVNGTRRDIYYSGQTVTVECLTNPFYFAGGIQWALSYENKTVQILNETDNQDPYLLVDNDEFSIKHNDHFDTLTITADENLVSVVCMAPVWNSSVWVHKAFFPYVNRSSVPQVVLVSEENSVVQWNVNETGKVIICEATGSPLPMFSWFKDNDTILASHNTDITEMRNGTNILRSTLTIQRVSYHSGGVYTCVASNAAGQNETSVQVHVLELSSMSAAAEVGITISCVLGVFLVGGLLLWKFSGSTGHQGWLDLLRQRIRRNSSSEGQNVDSNGSTGPRRGADGSNIHHVGGNSPDIYNQSFDSVTMRADLLN